MMPSVRYLAATCAFLCSSCASPGAVPAPATQPTTQPASIFDPTRHMHTSEVRPGMTGYGLSVFSGTKIERFDVEVISVLKNQMGPLHDVVLIRCHGQGLEHSGAIEGMSGSPIYLKDDLGRERMIGAFALGWEFSKDPIAGVRPIEEMLQVPTTSSATMGDTKPMSSRWNARTLVAAIRNPKPLTSKAQRSGAKLARLELPISVSGADSSFFEKIAPTLEGAGFTALQSGASAKPPSDAATASLEPGAAIALPICTGDLEMLAVGTVTERIGDQIFAFGHEFNAEGAVDLPMGVGYIHTIIPATNISFKLGSLIRNEGAIHNDESVGIAGTIGPVPAMIPVDVIVRTPQRNTEQTYHFDVVKHPKFTPLGLTSAITSAIMGHSALPADFTVKYAMQMDFDGGENVSIANTATSVNHAAELLRDLSMPLTLSLENPFKKTYPTKIIATFDVTNDVQATTLKSVATDKDIYKPGELLHLFVTGESHNGMPISRSIDFPLPEDLADGDYAMIIGDANRAIADESRYAPFKFDVRDIGGVFDLIRHETQSPASLIYVRLASKDEGISVGRIAMKGLPASRVRLLSKAGRADVLPTIENTMQSYDWGESVSGSVDLEIKIAKNPEKMPRPTGEPAAPLSPPPAPAAMQPAE